MSSLLEQSEKWIFRNLEKLVFVKSSYYSIQIFKEWIPKKWKFEIAFRDSDFNAEFGLCIFGLISFKLLKLVRLQCYNSQCFVKNRI